MTLTALAAIILVGQPVIELPEGPTTLLLERGLERFHDRSGTLDFGTVSSTSTFEQVQGAIANRSHLEGALWVRFRLKNNAKEQRRLYVRVEWPRLQHIEFYADGHTRSGRSGRSGWFVPFHQRPYWDPVHVFFVEAAPGATRVVYLRIKTDREMLCPITIVTEKAWPVSQATSKLILGLFCGMVLGLCIFSGLVFLRLRLRVYLFFSLSMMSFLAWWLLGSGWYGASEFFLRLSFLPIVILLNLWVFFRAAFTRALLELDVFAPSLDRLLRAVQFLGVPAVTILQIGIQGRFASAVGALFPLLLMGGELYAGWVVLKRGQRLAVWYLFATATLGGGMLLGMLIIGGVLQVSPWGSRMVIFAGVLAELFGLAYALAERIQVATREREQAVHAVEVERLGALHGLVAGVTHELNTPLGTLRSSASSMEKAAQKLAVLAEEADKRTQRAARVLPSLSSAIHAATERIDQVVRSLKMFAQLDEAEEQVCDLHEGLDSALTLLTPKLTERIEIERAFGASHKVRCRPAAINQVFISLLENAVSALQGEGVVRVETDSNEAMFSVRIKDTGIGIPEDQRAQLFTPKLTKKGVRVKMGMGLSTAKSIIDRHAGRITVQSEEGKGTEVRIELPTAFEGGAVS